MAYNNEPRGDFHGLLTDILVFLHLEFHLENIGKLFLGVQCFSFSARDFSSVADIFSFPL
jgi:hypothetical protein